MVGYKNTPKMVWGNSLATQWLRFCSSNAGSVSMISGQKPKFPQAVPLAPPKKEFVQISGKMGPLRFHQESEVITINI